MKIPINDFGVPQYPEGDARRLLVLLAAANLLERPTVTAIADLTSLPRGSIDAGLAALQQQYGVRFVRSGEVVHIDSWGDILREEGVMRLLRA